MQISNKWLSFQIPADEVAASFAERNNVFFKYSFESLKLKLDLLLQCGVDRESILKCRATFRMCPQRIEELVRNLKNGGVDKILSWMIVVPEQYYINHIYEL